MMGSFRKLLNFVRSRRAAGQSWSEIYQRIDNQLRFGRKSARRKVGRPEMRELREVIRSGNLLRGARVARFRERFRRMYGVNHAIPSTSGTAAVHTAVAAIDPGPGDEIITSPVTDIGTINPILYQGAVPVFADIDPETWCIDPRSVERLITPRTRAIIAVHLFGNPCDIDALRSLAVRHGIYLIEDCAQAHLSRYGNRLCGTMGDMGTFSFQHSKQMTTGEGGMTVTDNVALARRAELFTDKGWLRESRLARDYPQLGLNYRMNELQAAVGLAQLDRIESLARRRSRNGKMLAALLADVPGVQPQRVRPEDTSTWWQFAVKIDPDAPFTGRSLGHRLQKRGVPASTGYMTDPIFLYHQPLLKRRLFGGAPLQLERNDHAPVAYERGLCPVSEECLGRLVLLTPPNEHFSDKDVHRLYKEIKTVAESFSQPNRVSTAETTRVRAALIGCGTIASTHLRAIRATPGMDVVAISDINENALKTMGSEEDIEVRYTDYKKMLSEQKLDLAVICTWPGLHAEMTVAAAQAGVKNILCEKPISLSLADADAMIATCNEHGARLIVGHQHRFNPHIRIAHEAIRAGRLGKIRHIWGQHRSVLMNNGTHLIDCIRHLMDGEPVLWAYGQLDLTGGASDRGHAAEDASAGVIRFKNGVRAVLETGQIADPQHFRLAIYGSEGQIFMSYEEIEMFTVAEGQKKEKLPTADEVTDQYRELLACIDGRAQSHRNDAAEARADLEVLIGILESARLGQPIHFPVRQMKYPLEPISREPCPGVSTHDA